MAWVDCKPPEAKSITAKWMLERYDQRRRDYSDLSFLIRRGREKEMFDSEIVDELLGTLESGGEHADVSFRRIRDEIDNEEKLAALADLAKASQPSPWAFWIIVAVIVSGLLAMLVGHIYLKGIS